MIRRQLLDLFQRCTSQLIDTIQIKYILFFQHLYEFQEDLCRTFCIVHCPVMMMQVNMQRLCNRIQFKTIQLWQQNPGQSHGIQISESLFLSQPATIFFHKTDIKSSIVSYQYRISHKFQKLRQNLFDHRCIHDHIVIDAGQFFDTKRYRNLRIDKSRKPVCDLPMFHFYCTDLDNPVIHRTESGRFQVKNHKVSL